MTIGSTATPNLLGIGVYSVGEAARLTGTPAQNIRRWVKGYTFSRGDGQHAMPPVWTRDVPEIDGRIVLSFLDMMEIRFIKAFRQHHVSWSAIREAARLAAELFNDAHPFTRGKFRTDGNRIFKQIEEQSEIKLFDLNRRSWVFNEIVSRTLFDDVELSHDQVARWYPLHGKKAIVIDPRIAFGRPLVALEKIPTDVIAQAVKAEGSEDSVARWYGLSKRSIRAAVAFEKQLAA